MTVKEINKDFPSDDSQTSFERNERLIYSLAKKAHGRCLAAGVPMDFEDCKQEATIAWWKASEKFDPSRGFRFSTYLQKTVYTALNKSISDMEKSTTELGVVSMTGENMSLEEMLSDELDISPEEALSRQQLFDVAKAKMSRPSALALQIFMNPTDEFLEEVKRADSKATTMLENGVRGLSYSVNIPTIVRYVSAIYGLSNRQRQKIAAELNGYGA